MFNNLDINLVKNTLMRNLKAQFDATSQETLTPTNRPHPAKPETDRPKGWEPNRGVWTYKQEPEQR